MKKNVDFAQEFILLNIYRELEPDSQELSNLFSD